MLDSDPGKEEKAKKEKRIFSRTKGDWWRITKILK
jgi:hypothetical protein